MGQFTSSETNRQSAGGTSTRSLRGNDFFFLWAGAAIALSEIWAGGMLAPLGFGAGLAAIAIGRLIGNIPLAVAGHIGAVTGQPAMITTRGALGLRGSSLPALLNILQLIGWTAVMLWIAGQASSKLAPDLFSGTPAIWTLACGLLTTLWALGGPRLWRYAQQTSVVLLAALCVLATVLFLREHSLPAMIAAPPRGSLSFMAALDLVIAMPVSWMPLAADYARHAISPRRAFLGTYLGYFVAGLWMYALGLGAAIAANTNTPDAELMKLMAEAGWARAALVIVLISTITTTFLDVYSHAVSLQSMASRVPQWLGIALCGGLGTALALVMDPTRYEHFLILIGSVFCPLFGVVFVDFFFRFRGCYDSDRLIRGELNRSIAGIHPAGVAAWVAGCAVYHVIAVLHPSLGASLPSMVAGGMVYALLAGRKSTSP